MADQLLKWLETVAWWSIAATGGLLAAACMGGLGIGFCYLVVGLWTCLRRRQWVNAASLLVAVVMMLFLLSFFLWTATYIYIHREALT